MTTATINKTKKPVIESITIKHIFDNSPDVSWLGEYTDKYQTGAIKRYNAGNREYKYFIPGISYKEHWESLHKMGYSKGNCDYLARLYNQQDYKRMEALNNGDFGFIGIEAIATVKYSIGQGNFRLEELSSGGLWGIETDDKAGIQETEKSQLAELKEHLKVFGISVKNFDKIEIEYKEL
jgi:hypothetical protein